MDSKRGMSIEVQENEIDRASEQGVHMTKNKKI